MPCGQRKRWIHILAPGKSVPMVASSPYGQQQLRPGAPGRVPTQSPVRSKVLCAMPHGRLLSLRLAQSLSGHAWWHAETRGKLRQVRSHRLRRICCGWVHALICELAASTESKPHGLPQGLFDLHCRSTPKAFTSISNGLICLSPPLANTEGQGVFHLFIELQAGAIHPKLFFFIQWKRVSVSKVQFF